MPFYWGNKTLSLLSMTLLYKKMVKKKKAIMYPTFKSCTVSSDPLVQAGDSWTLRRVDHLLPSRGDRVKESESLLPMPPGSFS